MATVGFIGPGNMGGPMAANLVKAGHSVTGSDPNPAALDALVKAGGKAAEAVTGARVVITMLPAGERAAFAHAAGGEGAQLLSAGGRRRRRRKGLFGLLPLTGAAEAGVTARRQPGPLPRSRHRA